MRAMVLRAPKSVDERPLVLEEFPEPFPSSGEIRLSVRACGICHTELHTVEGELSLPRLPLVPGHQIVGIVDRVGDGVTRWKTGDRLGVGWLAHTCGQCEYCRRGRENLCPNARFTGLHVDGGYAAYVVADERFAYPIPPSYEDIQAAPLLCAGIIGFRSLRLSEVKPGHTLGLFGFGASAHLAIQVARHWGCAVYVFTRGEEHRHLARRLGATWTGAAEDAPPGPLDSAIIFAPAGHLVPIALAHLRPGGTLAINAIAMSPIPEMPYERIYMERTVRSVANFTRDDANDFLTLAAEIPVRADVQAFALEEANSALQRLKRGDIHGSAVLDISRD